MKVQNSRSQEISRDKLLKVKKKNEGKKIKPENKNNMQSDQQETGSKKKRNKSLKDITSDRISHKGFELEPKKKKDKMGKRLKKNSNEDGTSPNEKETCENKKRKQIRKKKHFNKDAIEKMKARQLAKKEKALKQTPPPKPEPKKRRRPKVPIRLESVDLRFEEDDTMTEFEGAWVPKEEAGRLSAAREDLVRRGLAPEKVERTMKQLVRREHRKLKLRLIGALAKSERSARERQQFLAAQGARGTPKVRRRLPGKACGLTLRQGEQLKQFDGFWVAAEAVARLEALRKRLADEGRSEAEARRLLRKARRAEERKVKSTGRLVCTRCGGRGHLGSDCSAPERLAAAGSGCFRCGQPGHRLSDCPNKEQITGVPFATCYLCQQRGHMSRDCPQRRQPAPDTGSAAGHLSWRGLAYDEDESGRPPAHTQGRPTTGKPATQRASKVVPMGRGNKKDKNHIRFD